MNLTQWTTSSNPKRVIQQISKQVVLKTTLNNTTTDNPTHPRVDAKPNCKKRRSECSEYEVGVWIICQHINDPRFSSSLKTIASNQSPFGPFNPIVVQKNKHQKSVHRRRTKQPQRRMQFTRYDKWQLPSTRSVYAPSPFEQHLAHVESINIEQTHIDEKPNLRLTNMSKSPPAASTCSP